MGFLINTNEVINTANVCSTQQTELGNGMFGGSYSGTRIGQSAAGTNFGATQIGYAAGNYGGDCHVAIGYLSMYNQTYGFRSVGIGFLAGWPVISGCSYTDTVVIGDRAACSSASLCNVVAIGHCALANTSGVNHCRTIALGHFAGCGSVCTAHTIIGNFPGSGLTSSGNLIIQTQVAGSGVCIFGACNGCIGFKNTAPATRVHTTGCIFATGEIIAFYSDRRLKENIIVIDCALDKISKLNGVSYNPNKLAEEFGFESCKKEVGLLSDEVEEVAPYAVKLAPFDLDENKQSKSGENYKTVKYERLVPLLVEAIKELTNQVEELEHILKDTE